MNTTVGEPVPRHWRYIVRPLPMSTNPDRSPSPGTNVPGDADAGGVAAGLPAGAPPESQPTIAMHVSTIPHTAGLTTRQVSFMTLLSAAARNRKPENPCSVPPLQAAE